ncbi:hypothetical protein [Pseudomonas sp. LB3P58]
MNISLTLPNDVSAWAKQQADVEAAVIEVLQTHVAAHSTPAMKAEVALREKAAMLPEDMEFEIPQILGPAIWSTLDRSSIVKFGKKVKAAPESFGLSYVRTTTSRHAVYKKFTMVFGLKPPVRF